MKKIHLFFPMLCAAAVLLAGCSDDKEAQVYSGITIATDRVVDLEYDATGFTVNYTLVGNAVGTEIEAQSHVSWIEVRSVTSDAVQLGIVANYKSADEETAPREGGVELSGPGLSPLTITFRQAGFAPDPRIEITGDQPVVIGKDDPEAVIEYRLIHVKNEKAVVEAESQAKWLTVKAIDTQHVTLAVNPEGAGEREGVVTLSYGKAASVEVTVRQEGGPTSEIVLREGSERIVADPNGNDERDENDLLTAYFEVVNPVPGASVAARTDDEWIVIVEELPSFIDFRTKGNDTEEVREGTITLSYPGAEEVRIVVEQGVRPDPVITIPGEQPLRVGRKGADVLYANYTIANRRGDETPTATPDVEWIRMTVTSTGYMGFSVDANTASEREGRIRLTYRNASPVDFVVLQAGAPAGGGEGLVLTVSDITATSATVGVVTYIDETYSVGVIPVADYDRFADDGAFLRTLVSEMEQEFASQPGGFYTFGQYFGLTADDSRTPFGADPESRLLESDTDYYAFAFDLTADADNRVSYSGTLYKTEFRTLPKEVEGDMTFEFSFVTEGKSTRLKVTPSDLTRPYCLCILNDVDLSGGAESVFRAYVGRAGEFYTGEAVSPSYLSKYMSPYVALACGYDERTQEITSTIAVYEFDFPPAATTALLRRARR